MKNKLVSAFNAATTYAGHVIAYTPPLLALAALSIQIGSGAGREGWFPLETVLMSGAISAGGLGLAFLGYSRIIGRQNTPQMQRGAFAHCFNFSATSVGAGASAISGLAALSALTDSGQNYSAGMYVTLGLGVLAGLAVFSAGYKRMLGKPRQNEFSTNAVNNPDVKP